MECQKENYIKQDFRRYSGVASLITESDGKIVIRTYMARLLNQYKGMMRMSLFRKKQLEESGFLVLYMITNPLIILKISTAKYPCWPTILL